MDSVDFSKVSWKHHVCRWWPRWWKLIWTLKVWPVRRHVVYLNIGYLILISTKLHLNQWNYRNWMDSVLQVSSRSYFLYLIWVKTRLYIIFFWNLLRKFFFFFLYFFIRMYCEDMCHSDVSKDHSDHGRLWRIRSIAALVLLLYLHIEIYINPRRTWSSAELCEGSFFFSFVLIRPRG